MRLVLSSVSAQDTSEIEKAIRAPADKPIELQGLVTASLPPAADYPYGVVYDLTTGKPKFSNGSTWAHFGPSTAADLAFAPTGSIAATDVQAAIAELGTEKQPLHANLTAFSGLSLVADRLPYANGAGTLTLATLTSFGRSLIDDADAAAGRTTLGLGTAATQNTGTSGANVPLLNGANTWSTDQTVTGRLRATFVVATGARSNIAGVPAVYLGYNSAGDSKADIVAVNGGVANVDLRIEALGMDLQTGGASTTIGMTSAGAVTFPRIGTTASAANAFLNSAASNNLLRSTSSRRYKTDIRDLDDIGADKLLGLRPVLYKSKAPADDPSIDHLGLIAEEVAEIAPWLVQYTINEAGQLIPDGVQYERLTVLLLHVLKRARARILNHENRIAALEGRGAAKGA